MKILITGGAGFIASNIADRYLELGHEVVIVDNLVTGQRENIPAAAKFYEMDICDDALKNVFEAEKPDIVNHHAAQMDVRKSVADPAYDAGVNVLGAINILQNCVKYKVKKFIFASTGGAIYGEQDYFPADEAHPNRPLSPYGITKLTTEKYLFFYNHVHGLNYTILRYANVYGPRQNPHGEAGVVAIFSQRMLRNEQPRINGEGTQTRDYVFVGDVVKANELALSGGANQIFNIGTGIETDVNTLFRHIAAQMDHEVPEVHAPAQPGEQMRSVLDASYIKKELGWEPTVPLAEGLKRTVNFFRSKVATPA
ncbi:MAG: NAD-dependent epimerase/dehydratase family protein [Calditrichaeota bacterium]|nr:NAD-dependent epimerase/dehydratase family protein [Calditrichota bacterium]MCB0304431.1 NAD-dependent epimerase/dehydratase family protein [Calditrichota bacterium]MCB9088092.1 NAD-dependent epimerase/dehydratase family protein [Calditrichia bacterium]